MPSSAYTGRFAPTPSGRLHFGSVAVCLGAWLRARSLGGRLLLRIDDLDRPRCPAGMDRIIISELETLGFKFDGPPLYESERTEYYAGLCRRLQEHGRAFYCNCTRAALKRRPCRCCQCQEQLDPRHCSLRFRPGERLKNYFYDELSGRVEVAPSGVFLTLRRADGLFAYNLACVGDDFRDGVNEVVRGRDLEDTTPAQIALFEALGYRAPRYLHLPLALNGRQGKLSKQNHAPAVLDRAEPAVILLEALRFLGQDTSALHPGMPPREILQRACQSFSPRTIPRGNRLAPELFC